MILFQKVGVDFKLRTIQVGDKRVKLQVWDTGKLNKLFVTLKDEKETPNLFA